MRVRTRFAPSPTGYLHVGGYRTALYGFYVARQNKGDFLLRIEDTDQEREVPGAAEALVRVFGRMGITFDEGPTLNAVGALEEKGAKGPYTQSKRLDLYKKYAAQLVEAGHAYRCFCTRERLEEVRKIQETSKQPMKYDRHCLKLSAEESAARATGEPHVIRVRMPDAGVTETQDVIRGTVRFPNQDQEDFIALKTDGFPTYHLASVVDDHLMEISHVIRAEEWLSSLPKHYRLYEAFGWDKPTFAHLPLILNPDKSKLSKRQGDVAVEDYLAKGYLPEALENFLSLIGYNPKGDQEIYTREEMISLFDLSKVNSAGGVFNLEKLDWMNQQYIQKKDPKDLADLCRPFLTKPVDTALLEKICVVERNRLVKLADINASVESFTVLPEFDATLLVWKKADAEDAIRSLQIVAKLFDELPESAFDDIKKLETEVLGYIAANGLKNGNVLWPTRVALSGRAMSPGPFEIAFVLGKKETLKRLDAGLKKLAA